MKRSDRGAFATSSHMASLLSQAPPQAQSTSTTRIPVLSSTYKPLVSILLIFFQRLAMPRLFPLFYDGIFFNNTVSSLTRPFIALRESWTVNASPGDANRHSLFTWTHRYHENINRKDDVILLDQIRICFLDWLLRDLRRPHGGP